MAKEKVISIWDDDGTWVVSLDTLADNGDTLYSRTLDAAEDYADAAKSGQEEARKRELRIIYPDGGSEETYCCVYGCSEPAIEWAARNVPYCAKHAASNRESTRQYMNRISGFGR